MKSFDFSERARELHCILFLTESIYIAVIIFALVDIVIVLIMSLAKLYVISS